MDERGSRKGLGKRDVVSPTHSTLFATLPFPSESSLLACLPEGHTCVVTAEEPVTTRLEALTVRICQDGTTQRARKETLVAFGGEAVQEPEVVGITSMTHYFG